VGQGPADDNNLDEALELLSPFDRLVLGVLRQAVRDLSSEEGPITRAVAACFLRGPGAFWAGHLGFDVAAWLRSVGLAQQAAGELPAFLDQQPIVFRELECAKCGFAGRDTHALATHWAKSHSRQNALALVAVARWVEGEREYRLHLLAKARGVHEQSARRLLRRAKALMYKSG
jgi:hypothetical protein